MTAYASPLLIVFNSVIQDYYIKEMGKRDDDWRPVEYAHCWNNYQMTQSITRFWWRQ